VTESSPSLKSNGRKLETSILERVRGPAIALLSALGSAWQTATAQPVVRVRQGNRTADAGPTPGAPVLALGGGGFEFSHCIDAGDTALAIPLESDHAGFLASGKVSDPATPRVHDRALAVSLPVRVGKAGSAGAGELYLGHAGKGLYLKISRDTLALEIEVAGVSAQIRIGKGATLGAARLGDPVDLSPAMALWVTNVTAAAMVAPLVGDTIGQVSGASSKTVIE
jgi:hypothetical protein